MKNNLPNDQFEDFLKRSLGQYEEDPDDRVWSKIDETLDNKPVIRPLWHSRKFWLAAAGITLFLSVATLVYSNLSLKYQLKELAKSHRSQNNTTADDENLQNNTNELKTEIQTPEEPKEPLLNNRENNETNLYASGTEKNKNNLIPATDLQNKNATTTNSELVDRNLIKKDNNQGEINKKIQKIGSAGETQKGNLINTDLLNNKTKRTDNNSIGAISAKDKKKSNIRKDSYAAKSRQNKIKKDNSLLLSAKADDLPIKEVTSNDNIIQDKEIAQNDLSKNRKSLQVSTLQQLSIYEIEYKDSYRLNQVVFTPIGEDPIKLKKANSFVVSAGLLNESGTIKNETPGRPLPGGPPRPTIDRVNTFETSNSWQLNVGYNHAISNNFSFITGLGYKTFNTTNLIEENFVLKEKRKPGSGPDKHDFDFTINCAGGKSEITVQSEQLDPRASISESEPINLKVKTNYSVAYLSLPLMLQYQQPISRKWSILAGAGINFDFIVHSKFNTPEITISSAQLKLSPARSPGVNFDQSKDIVINSKFNLGLGYKIARNISLFAAPELFIPLNNRAIGKGIKEQSIIAGGQIGLAININSL